VLKGSKKANCPAYLTVTVYADDPTMAEVRLHKMHNHGTGSLATAQDLWVRMIAPELQTWILRTFTVVKDIDVVFRILNVPGTPVPDGTRFLFWTAMSGFFHENSIAHCRSPHPPHPGVGCSKQLWPRRRRPVGRTHSTWPTLGGIPPAISCASC